MKRELKNLFNQEEIIVLNLSNCSFQAKQYLERLKLIKLKHGEGFDNTLFSWYENIFEYYVQHLIPAFQDMGEMEERHLHLSSKNPDTDYKPFLLEFKNYKSGVDSFFIRFEEIHKEFYSYCLNLSN